MKFFDELKRRRVFRVAFVYAIVAWVIIQVSDTVLPRLGLPEWAVTLVIVLVLIGAPIALILAWAFDVGPDGVTRAPPAPPTISNAGRIAVVGAVVVLAGVGIAFLSSGGETAQASIAVMPFVDMSPSKDQEYFGDGITEEILNVLAQVKGLRVPGRTSSFSFKGKHLSIKEIAQQLEVGNILEGSIRKSGNRVRITAQLIDAKSDKHLWSETYDRDLSDVFAVQDEIAHAIVDALRLQMQPPTVAKATNSARAHETYLKGLYYWHRRHVDELPKALDLMRQATQQDPSYARAWAGLALTAAVLPQYDRNAMSRDDAIEEGKAAARKAIQLDPKSADAYAALGQIAQELEWDWKAAEDNLNKAVEIDPQYATAHQWRAELYVELGRYNEAQAEIERAIEIDPLSTVIQSVRAFGFHMSGQSEKALPVYKAMKARDPQVAFATGNFVTALILLKRYQEALDVDTTTQTAKVLRGLLNPAQQPAAIRLLADPAYRTAVSAERLSRLYMAFGMPDSAATVLNRAAMSWQGSLGYIPLSPTYAAIRNQPQFIEFKRRLNL